MKRACYIPVGVPKVLGARIVGRWPRFSNDANNQRLETSEIPPTLCGFLGSKKISSEDRRRDALTAFRAEPANTLMSEESQAVSSMHGEVLQDRENSEEQTTKLYPLLRIAHQRCILEDNIM